MSAIRLARAYTGENKIVKFSGCYHGHADGLMVKSGSGALAQGVPTSAGVPEAYAGETLVADYNDVASVEACLDSYPGQVAAVIVEPVAGNMGMVPPAPGFLATLRDLTPEAGSLLILDEVITGFRVAYGGAQALYEVEADITCLGKIIGGGLPVGAYGGRREIMEVVAPLGPMYQAGTLSGNPLAVAAGVATLRALQRPGVYQRLESLGARLEDGLKEATQEAEVPLTINRVGSMFTAFFTPGPVAGLRDAEESDTRRYARFFHGMLDRGFTWRPLSTKQSSYHWHTAKMIWTVPLPRQGRRSQRSLEGAVPRRTRGPSTVSYTTWPPKHLSGPGSGGNAISGPVRLLGVGVQGSARRRLAEGRLR